MLTAGKSRLDASYTKQAQQAELAWNRGE